jgi:hypothetical protein
MEVSKLPDAVPVWKARRDSGLAAMPQAFDKQISALDGVRGLAIIMVLLVHLELYQSVPSDSCLMLHVRDLFWAAWGE